MLLLSHSKAITKLVKWKEWFLLVSCSSSVFRFILGYKSPWSWMLSCFCLTMFSCRRPCLLPFCSCCCAEIVYLHSACLLWLLRYFTIWKAPNSSVVDKKPKHNVLRNKIYQSKKLRAFFFSFCESISEGQHNKSHLLWLCSLVVLHVPEHSCVQPAFCWRVCMRLATGHSGLVELTCPSTTTVQGMLLLTAALQHNQRSVGLLRLPHIQCHCCAKSWDFTYTALWHPTGRRWNFEAWSEI